MDKYINEYKSALKTVTAERDIVSAAKKRAAENSRPRYIRYAAAAACAVLIMGGTTVYAAQSGWLDRLFGNTSSVISDNRSDYAVKTTSFKSVRSDENFPYDISFGEMICDGTILYGEMHLSGKNNEKITENTLTMEADVIINGNTNASRQTAVIFLNENGDGSADAAFSVCTDSEIYNGSSVAITLFESPVSADSSDSAEFSFNIIDMPQAQSKHIAADCASAFTTYTGETTEMRLTDIVLSPLCLSFKGHCGSYESFQKLTDSPNIRIDLSDGSCLYIDKRQWQYDRKTSPDIGEKVCETSGFSCSASSDGGYDISYNTQFRCVLPTDDIVSVTIGDVTVPVE